MDFSLSHEQRELVSMVEKYVAKELVPHEDLLETTNEFPEDLRKQLHKKSIALGLHACNMPESVGGGGLRVIDVTLVEKALGYTSLALAESVHRPLNILAACEGEQIDAFLRPTIEGHKRDCIAMTEPGAGSDLRSMRTQAKLIDGHW
ncbi:MAG: acyl-CoA dehydrogenase family protein, partial [Pseudomonadota bacterium]